MRSLSSSDRLEFERVLWAQGIRRLAGLDEAGRGPLAGPVVAAAVILPLGWIESGVPEAWRDLNDSKQMSARQRDRFFELLTAETNLHYAIAQVDAETIDRVNILQATHQAMAEALAGLAPAAEHVLVDGLPVSRLKVPQTAVVKGDARSYSIAAASILAKVTRDRLMLEYDRRWPVYGFAGHKGYGTAQHLAALRDHGPCSIHRRTFAPLRPEAQTELSLFNSAS